MPKNKKSFFNKLSDKYVVSFRNTEHFLETSKATLSLGEILSLLLLSVFVIAALSLFIARFTPVRQYMYGNAEENKDDIFELNRKVDSLSGVIQLQNHFVKNMQRVLLGDDFSSDNNYAISDSLVGNRIEEASADELNYRNKIIERQDYNVLVHGEPQKYLEPITGYVSLHFEPENEHFGVDIVAPKGTPIKSIANGQVIYSSWTVDDGYSIIIEDSDGTIAIYKHCEKLLKQINDTVKAGEVIALIGDSGKNSTGYHLHFELWKDGQVQNPTDYFDFE